MPPNGIWRSCSIESHGHHTAQGAGRVKLFALPCYFITHRVVNAPRRRRRRRPPLRPPPRRDQHRQQRRLLQGRRRSPNHPPHQAQMLLPPTTICCWREETTTTTTATTWTPTTNSSPQLSQQAWWYISHNEVYSNRHTPRNHVSEHPAFQRRPATRRLVRLVRKRPKHPDCCCTVAPHDLTLCGLRRLGVPRTQQPQHAQSNTYIDTDTRHKTQDTRHKTQDTRHNNLRHKTQDTRHTDVVLHVAASKASQLQFPPLNALTSSLRSSAAIAAACADRGVQRP